MSSVNLFETCNLIQCTNESILFPSIFIKVLLEKLKKNDHKGLILNITSSNLQSYNYFSSLYGASSNYFDYLSQSLNQKYSREGIFLQSVRFDIRY